MRLKDKTAIITGAGSGIGYATATLFGAEGANVVCADIDQESALATCAHIRKAGGVATPAWVELAGDGKGGSLVPVPEATGHNVWGGTRFP